jgi:hypothetical protein
MQFSKIISIIMALALGVQAAPAPVPEGAYSFSSPFIAARNPNPSLLHFPASKDENWDFGVNCKRGVGADGVKDENWRFCIET